MKQNPKSIMDKVQELLKPRVRCKGTGEHHFPGSEFKPGEILDVAQDGARLVSQKTGKSVDWLKYKHYPHLFEEISWWEDRKPEEMPEYVKHTKVPEVIVKVTAHFTGYMYSESGGWPYVSNKDSLIIISDKKRFTNDRVDRMYYDYLPATEKEYNNSVSSQPPKPVKE